MRRTTWSICWYSVRSVLRNLRRTGVLKNRSLTSTVVPTGCAAGSMGNSTSPSTVIRRAIGASGGRDVIVTRATEAMLARASPRNPRLATRARSSASRILLVA
jgi:hypothetical protein